MKPALEISGSGDNDTEAYRRRLYQSYVSTHYSGIRTPGTLSTAETAYFDRHFKRFLPEDRAVRILDIGCGYGGLLLYLLDEGYRDLVGIDRSVEQVRIARSVGLNVAEMDAQEYLDQNTGEFDVIFAVDLIEHLNRIELLALLDGAFSSLKVGGKLVLQAPNAVSPLSGRLRYGDLTHEQSFTAESIAQALRVCRFSLVEVYGVEPAMHGMTSAIRRAMWQVIRMAVTGYLIVETGVVRRHIVSQNLIAVAARV